MSRAALLSFSARGALTAERIAQGLGDGWNCELYAPKGNLKQLTAELFPEVDALVFVGACGIAVRAIAPHLVSKLSDPAVLVVDERGEHAISLLSGHIGGANQLARRVAQITGGEAVITTATDVNRRFAADEWAARHGIYIEDMGAAKRFSADILGRDLPLKCDFAIEGELPPGLYAGDTGERGLAITCGLSRPFGDTLRLVPRALHVGLGCRRGISAEAIAEAVDSAFAANELCAKGVRALASIDIKRGEAGLLAYAEARCLPLEFYTAEELNAVPGEFTASQFVKQTTGVDNVCERAAARSAGEGARVIVKKTSLNGVTVAVALADWRVSFE